VTEILFCSLFCKCQLSQPYINAGKQYTLHKCTTLIYQLSVSFLLGPLSVTTEFLLNIYSYCSQTPWTYVSGL